MSPKFTRSYAGIDDNLSEDWAVYWDLEAKKMRELEAMKQLLLQRTFTANRVNNLIVENCKFAVIKPKMIKDDAVLLWERTFDQMAPTIEKLIPEVVKIIINYEQVENDLGLNCPRTKITYRGNQPKHAN